jgi:integrase
MATNHSKRTGDAASDQQPDFARVAENLYRRMSTGMYYALVKRGRKQFRRSLKTTDRSLANRKLTDLRKKIANLTLTDTRSTNFEAVAKSWLDSKRHTLKPKTINRREVCIKGLTPFLNSVPIRNISSAQCAKWLERRGNKLSASSFVQELDTLRLILDYAVSKGLLLDNSARGIQRRKVVTERITVPSREQFQQIITAIRDADGEFGTQGKGSDGADLVELLAYSGCRLQEATNILWSDVDLEHSRLVVTGGEGGTKNHEARTIPITSALRELLLRLTTQRKPVQTTDPVSRIKDAKKCLQTACRNLGLPHFTHHDFRHFFATTCIESGVDIPTISRWLGHKDGGGLAMKTYGHLRDEHSLAMSKPVSFSPVTSAESRSAERCTTPPAPCDGELKTANNAH